MKVYNTLTRKKEIFKPKNKNKVKMFVCGITPYDHPHIGNIRSMLNYDFIAKYLRFRNYNIFYLQNITDIDDKIIKKAKEENKNYKEISKKYFSEFKDVLKILKINSVNKYAKATSHIKEIIFQIETLIKKGYAYKSGGSVFFEVKKFKDYGKLSHQNITKLRKAVRIEKDENKKDPLDFALWKARKDNEPYFNSPFGKGRPGWHIEDTAITEHYFGPQYDIHGGGIDLIFPHHECEIAQQESASGKKPFVKYWVHAGLVYVEGEKMSKSIGNIIPAKELLERYNNEEFRFAFLSVHYRSILNFSYDFMDEKKRSLHSLKESFAQIKKYKPKDQSKECKIIKGLIKKFFNSLDDDFNTPKAFGYLFSLEKRVNKKIEKNTLTNLDVKNIKEFLEKFKNIFEINLLQTEKIKIPNQVKILLKKRETLRKEKKWHEADIIRDKILNMGYIIEDTPNGPKIKRKN